MPAILKEEPFDPRDGAPSDEEPAKSETAQYDNLVRLGEAQWKKLKFPPPSCAVTYTDIEQTLPRVLEDTVEAAFIHFETGEREYKLKESGLMVPESQLRFGRGASVWVVPPGEKKPSPGLVLYVRDDRSQEGGSEVVYSVQVDDDVKSIHHFVPSESVQSRTDGSTPSFLAPPRCVGEMSSDTKAGPSSNQQGHYQHQVASAHNRDADDRFRDSSGGSGEQSLRVRAHSKSGNVDQVVAKASEHTQSSKTRTPKRQVTTEERDSTPTCPSQTVGENTSQLPLALLTPLRASRESGKRSTGEADDSHAREKASVASKKRSASPEESATVNQQSAKRRKGSFDAEQRAMRRKCLVLPRWVDTKRMKDCFDKNKSWLEKKTKCNLRLRGYELENKNSPLPFTLYVCMQGKDKDIQVAPVHIAKALCEAHQQTADENLVFMYEIAAANPYHFRHAPKEPGQGARIVHQRSGMPGCQEWKWMWRSKVLLDCDVVQGVGLLVGQRGCGVAEIRRKTGCNVRVCSLQTKFCIIISGDSVDDINECRKRAQARIEWVQDFLKQK